MQRIKVKYQAKILLSHNIRSLIYHFLVLGRNVIKMFVLSRLEEEISTGILNVLMFIFIILICYFVDVIIRKILLKILKKYSEKTKNNWDDIIIKKRVVSVFVKIIPLSILYNLAYLFGDIQKWIEKISFAAIIIVVLLTLDRLLTAINEIYNSYAISKARPIRGYLQVIQIILYIVATILVISEVLEKNPWYFLSGLGAATAVLILIFQNSILGLVAGIEIAANDMLQIGDWIELDKYGADGEVIEITLHTVKIRNFDMTITTIPSHLLIADSFKNWRGMEESGVRRIMRYINIDMNSIRLYTNEDIDNLFNKKHIVRYLNEDLKEVFKFKNDDSRSVNYTNAGVFRAYLETYLSNYPDIRTDLTLLVRQLQPTEKGLPIEVYAFTNETQWEKYEAVQADIFDHILAVINEFDLRVYQEPSGFDLNN